MKTLMMTLAVCGCFSLGARAQMVVTGSGMQPATGTTSTINTNTNAQPAANEQMNASLSMRELELRQRNRYERDRKYYEIDSDDLPYRSVYYDTSKNNGHCLGCGSGTLTDPHPWQ